MQQTKIRNCFLVLSVLFVISCSDATTDSEKTDKDTTATKSDDKSTLPAYDAAMDPLTVEAAFANKLADTLNIKMYEVTLKPGDSVAMHTHPDHTLYVLQGGKLSITVKDGTTQELDLKAGMGMVAPAETHHGKNIGTTTVKLLLHDIYREREK